MRSVMDRLITTEGGIGDGVASVQDGHKDSQGWLASTPNQFEIRVTADSRAE